MFDPSQSQLIAKQATSVLLKTIADFPETLAKADPDKAAQIVADLLKAAINRPSGPRTEEDAAAELKAIIAACERAAEAEAAAGDPSSLPPPLPY